MEIKELKLEDLTVEQKLGMVMCGHINNLWDEKKSEANAEYALQMIREHRLGAVWMGAANYKLEEFMAKVKEIADYPILIITDAESGYNYNNKETDLIGCHNAIGTCNTTESAYAFGKVTAVNARKMGYNVVCNPVLDMIKEDSCCSMTMRSLGSDKVRVTELAAAETKGMHDGGVLTVGKHFPSAGAGDKWIDSQMAETAVEITKEEIVDYYW